MSVIQVNNEEARSWTEKWLNAGHAISSAVLANAPFDQGIFQTCIRDDATMKHLAYFNQGGIVDARQAETWLVQMLDELTLKGAKCLIVEDDLSSATDPSPINNGIPSAFVADRVVSWYELSPEKGDAAFREVMCVGSGYPRNAFVVNRSPSELGLVNAQQVPKDFPHQVAHSLLAVSVSIFDDESYLVWTPK